MTWQQAVVDDNAKLRQTQLQMQYNMASCCAIRLCIITLLSSSHKLYCMSAASVLLPPQDTNTTTTRSHLEVIHAAC
jgi:hypothetical protein